MHNNPNYFNDLLDLMLKSEKLSLTPVTNVCRYIARDVTRNSELSAVFLKAVTYRFLQRAAKGHLGIQVNFISSRQIKVLMS